MFSILSVTFIIFSPILFVDWFVFSIAAANCSLPELISIEAFLIFDTISLSFSPVLFNAFVSIPNSSFDFNLKLLVKSPLAKFLAKFILFFKGVNIEDDIITVKAMLKTKAAILNTTTSFIVLL